MPKKPVAVTLRKPQAPADVESFVGSPSTRAPVRAMPANPLDSAADVEHAARAYREMTFYLPAEVARELSFYCMDHNCDANRVVAQAVSKHVICDVSASAPSVATSGWGGTLHAVMEHVHQKLSMFRRLRPF
jgi:hypothetical protein